MMLAFGLLVIGVLARFIPHIPNFTPVIALALFGGCYLKKQQALWLPLSLMVISDFFLGFHSTILFTWGAVALVSLVGMLLKKKKTPVMIMGAGLLSAVLFFMITNFGAWLSFYPLTKQGFVECYIMAIPFFRMELASTFIYSVVLFGTYECVVRCVDKTTLVKILK